MLNCHGAKGVPEGEALDLLVDLHFNLYLWSWALGSDQKDEPADAYR